MVVLDFVIEGSFTRLDTSKETREPSDVKVVVWQGYCQVSKHFVVSHVELNQPRHFTLLVVLGFIIAGSLTMTFQILPEICGSDPSSREFDKSHQTRPRGQTSMEVSSL